jgi:hypothetical protein
MSYLKTGATSDIKILAIILTPYGLIEYTKKLLKMQKKNFDCGMLPAKHSRCAHGMALKNLSKKI